MNQNSEEGLMRHDIEALFMIIKSCEQGGNKDLRKRAEEALEKKENRGVNRWEKMKKKFAQFAKWAKLFFSGG